MSLAPREIEKRYAAETVELRAKAGDFGQRRVGGYASVFRSPSSNLGGFVEIVEPRAFNKAQADNWPGVVCRFEHQSLLGTTAAGTLQLGIDGRGLDYEVDLPDTTAGNDVLELTNRTDLRSSSFSFQVYDQDWTYDEVPIRHLTSVRLIDVAPVTTPAYPDATVGLRSLAVQFDADPDDVFAMAREDKLRKLWVRSGSQPVTMNGAQALKELMRMAPVDRQLPLTPAEMFVELTKMAVPQPYKSGPDAMAELTRMAIPYQTADSLRLNY